MKKINKFIKPVLALSIVFALSSCNNAETKKEETEKTEEAVVEEFKPFKVLQIHHTVADFDKWKVAFDGHDSIRKFYGITNLALGTGIDNPNLVFIVNKIDGLQSARDFTALPELKTIMQEAGVTGKPELAFNLFFFVEGVNCIRRIECNAKSCDE